MDARTPAVLDTSFWVHAFAVGLLQHVLRLYAVHYTPEVASELPDTFASGREFRWLVRSGELTEVIPRHDRVGMFGAGERSALNVALEHRDWVLLLDDVRPFSYAAGVGLRIVYSPRLVVLLREEGAIGHAAAMGLLGELARLATVSPELIALAISLLPRR